MKNLWEKVKKYCPMSLKDWVITLLTMGAGFSLCIMLQQVTSSDTHVPIVFVLVVLLIALFTDGFFYGILASVISVVAVNWAFTYPYRKLDFTLYGYPLTFVTMLAVSIAASATASGFKEREKLKQATEAERIRSTLLRSMSHDLRTPLTAIGGSISAILDNPSITEEERTELLVSSREDVDWLCRMVENLLSVTKVSGPGSILKQEELPEEILGEVVAKFRKKHPEIAIDVSCPETAFFVPMDGMLIEQALMNLMDNCVIHGKGMDRITLRVKDLGDCAGFFVRDNGCGIDPSLLPHLFDGSLEPGSEQANDSNRYTGLGLAVCRTIVEAHGGKITALNHSSGAEFMFTLPKEENT